MVPEASIKQTASITRCKIMLPDDPAAGEEVKPEGTAKTATR